MVTTMSEAELLRVRIKLESMIAHRDSWLCRMKLLHSRALVDGTVHEELFHECEMALGNYGVEIEKLLSEVPTDGE